MKFLNAKTAFSCLAALTLTSLAWAQSGRDAGASAAGKAPKKEKNQVVKTYSDEAKAQAQMQRVFEEGLDVRIKDIARFRGVRSNQLMGYGLVVGLGGTGDSQKTPFTSTLIANAMRKFGTVVDPQAMNLKNVATVSIIAELPPFASPGNNIDVTVQSIGDAKSLEGGILLQAALFGAGDDQNAIAVAQGPVTVGGFNASGGGSSTQKNHVTVGRVSSGAIVERSVPYQMVFPGNVMYLELEQGDITTAERIAAKLQQKFSYYRIKAIDGGTVALQIPTNVSPMRTMAEVENTIVKADIPAVVTINERTGTITISGNVKLGPAIVARGSLKVIIRETNEAGQQAPFTTSPPPTVTNTEVSARESEVQIGVIGPSSTLSDLAKLFQKLKVSATDMIAILDQLRAQGALKARVKVL